MDLAGGRGAPGGATFGDRQVGVVAAEQGGSIGAAGESACGGNQCQGQGNDKSSHGNLQDDLTNGSV